MEDFLEKISYLYPVSNERATLGNPIVVFTFDELPCNYVIYFKAVLFELFISKKYTINIKLENEVGRTLHNSDVNFKLEEENLSRQPKEDRASSTVQIEMPLSVTEVGRYRAVFMLKDLNGTGLDSISTYIEFELRGDYAHGE
ncbi:hypothetical protein LZ578_08560 [Jeotgalibaca sp. MA1X17-3]|uniref:hypothetical protein n=1 Tax=Jeotgalibaca sp. MA1X17-3 TaxID=2908211 RepID=UPI001F31A4E9|nr:hypothetical protein [Jeotgalibaca sp. MA1X17-3]UJF15050.1 hypothetical protein LZ578_08560 [Jeotgalibaca sp. MA1X17-3]